MTNMTSLEGQIEWGPVEPSKPEIDLSTVNRENMAKFVEALRSQKFKKIQGSLRVGDRYCAEGVACEVSGQGHWNLHPGFVDDTYEYVDSQPSADWDDPRETTTMTPMVREWLGVGAGFPLCEEAPWSSVMTANDDTDERSFDEIAAWVEKTYLA